MSFLKIILPLIFLLFSTAQAKYVCTADQAFVDWMNQEPIDVNDDTVLVKYSDMASCQSQCRNLDTCTPASSSTEKTIASLATHYSEAEKDNIESAFANKNISEIKLSTMGPSVIIPFDGGFDGSLFVFPTGDTSGGELTNTVYSKDGVVVQTRKVNTGKTETEPVQIIHTQYITQHNTQTIEQNVNNNANEIIGFEIDGNKVLMSTPLTSGIFAWDPDGGTKTIYDDGENGLWLITQSGSHKKFYIRYKNKDVDTTAYQYGGVHIFNYLKGKVVPGEDVYRVTFKNGASTYRQSDDIIINSLGAEEAHESLGMSALFDLNGYTCPLFGSDVNINGDVDANIFSTMSGCANECYQQNTCIEWSEGPKCKPSAYDKSNPISDHTGKTVFTTYDMTWDCDTSTVAYGECLESETQLIEDNTTFSLAGIGWKEKDMASADQALTSVAQLEQMQHMWSGWNGMCENGTLYDNTWMSDPMTLLSFAMMAYSGALEGAYGGEGGVIQQGAKSVDNAFKSVEKSMDTFSKGIAEKFDSFFPAPDGSMAGNSAQAIQETTTKVAGDVAGGVTETKTIFTDMKEWYNTDLIKATDYTQAVTYGSATFNVAQLTMAAFSPPEQEDFGVADDFLKAQMGATDSSVAAVNYVQCMSSIGLSFPNQVGYTVDSNESMSAELRDPWKNVLSMSTTQIAHLMHATSPDFVKKNFIELSYDGGVNIGRYITSSPLAYTQAGQVLCGGGDVAKSINMLNQIASDNSEGDGINAKALGSTAISSGLSYLPAPYNLAASIAFKVLTSLSSGDACTDEKIAMKWGEQQFKTYKAVGFGQCRLTGSECAAKWVIGGCMRNRAYYCCYDQEMTRIFVEGVKDQLGKPWSINNCDDVKLEELSEIAFRRCLDSENPQDNKCFSQASWDELNNAIKKQTSVGFDASGLADAAIDSMPIGDDPWGPRIGD